MKKTFQIFVHDQRVVLIEKKSVLIHSRLLRLMDL